MYWKGAKISLAGQTVYCKKEFRCTKYILKSSFGRQNYKSSLDEQNAYCIKKLRWTKHTVKNNLDEQNIS